MDKSLFFGDNIFLLFIKNSFFNLGTFCPSSYWSLPFGEQAWCHLWHPSHTVLNKHLFLKDGFHADFGKNKTKKKSSGKIQNKNQGNT